MLQGSLVSACLLGLGALAGCASSPTPSPVAGPTTPVELCDARKFFLGAPEATFDGFGFPRAALDALFGLRRGVDGVEGTADDARVDLDAVRAALGEADFARIWAEVSMSKRLTPCASTSVQLLAFNDFHGALEEPSGRNGIITTESGPVETGGLKWLAARIAELAAGEPNTVVVGAGDMIGASPLISAAFHDEPTIEGLAIARLAISAVGNHEFDEGRKEIERIQHGGCHPVDGCYRDTPWAGAAFQYLAANVVDRASGAPVLPATVVRRFGHLRVGFIGMTLEGTGKIVRADGVADVDFLDEAETANRYARELKASGVDTIVVLLHEGGLPKGSYRGCEAISGPIVAIAEAMSADIDVIVSGHTHQPYVCDIAGKLVTSAASNGRLVTDIDLVLDDATGRVIAKKADNVLVTRTGRPHAEAEAHVAYWAERVRDVAAAVIGRSTMDLTGREHPNGQSDLGVVIANAHLYAERDKSAGGAQLAFTNGRGIRGDILKSAIAGTEAEGEITFGEAFAVQPFQNELITVTLTGAQLLALLESQFVRDGAERDRPKMLQTSDNVAYTWRRSAPIGKKVDIKTLRIDGVPFDVHANYRVAMNAYLAGGGDDYPILSEGTDRKVGIYDIDALVYYLKKHGPITKVTSPIKVAP